MAQVADKDTANGSRPPLDSDAFDVGSTEDSLDRLVKAASRQPGLFRIHSPQRQKDIWIINNPEDIKRVLVTKHRNFTKGLGLDRIKILLGHGIMTSEGDLWRSQRRMIQPAFNRKSLDRMTSTIYQHMQQRSGQWLNKARLHECVDITNETSELTLEIILDLIFSEDLTWLSEQMGGNPFALVNEHAERDLKFAYQFRSLCRLVGELLKHRRAQKLERFDFLNALMEATDKDSGAPMTDRMIVDEAMTLVVAGHETTASSLNWIWYLLSKHPMVTQKLTEELKQHPCHGPLSFAQLDQYRYTEAVVKEALRLYPPGWILSRRTISSEELSGFKVPADTDVMLSPYLIQRHPHFWSQPNEFRPERFLEATVDPRDEWIYIPFAAGPRHCVGEHLAMYEMMLHVITVAQQLTMENTDSAVPAIEAAINLRTRSSLLMRLHLVP